MTTTAIAARFRADTANHQLTVLHDDGLYRHLRFKAPDTGFYWFDLVTWPGRLAVTGDMGSYLFSREEDMLAFFRAGKGRVNASYWAEKLPDGRDSVTTYSEDKLRGHVEDHVASYGGELPGLREAAEAEILGDDAPWDLSDEDGARIALRDFRFLPESGVRAELVAKARAERDRIDADPTSSTLQRVDARLAYDRAVQAATFRFTDTWEWDLRDWDFRFLWACHAIVWGIGVYDAAKQAVPA